MRIFKFGGASVKDANAVKNIVNILKSEGTKDLLVVISAMGKMTNAFERLINAYFYKKENLKKEISFIQKFHLNIIDDLFSPEHNVHNKITILLGEISGFMARNTATEYNYVYDQLVGFGELLSSTIVSEYIAEKGIKNTWLDVRKFIKTDNTYRDAKINWETTQKTIKDQVNTSKLNITQGFLGGYKDSTTTLGREGSDYSAGVFAYCLNAESVTIWKDVEGVLNADPRVFSETKLLKNISYTEAIEMAFYGASIIHPKTIQPLEQKNIPLYVRSFEDLTKQGSCVSAGEGIKPLVPCFIVKKNQILISISAKDFSFMVEENISYVFKKLHEYQLKTNLIQNSAISFSVCVDDNFGNFTRFCNDLQGSFNLKTYHNVTLFTIRHFDNNSLQTIKQKGKSIIQQININIAQLAIQETI